MRIEPAQIADISKIINIHKDTFSCNFYNLTVFSSPRYDQYVKDLMSMHDHLFKVVLVNNHIIGYFHLLLENDHLHLNYVCIAKNYWGRGYGSNILFYIIQIAREMKINKISLDVMASDDRALDLYKKYNFDSERTCSWFVNNLSLQKTEMTVNFDRFPFVDREYFEKYGFGYININGKKIGFIIPNLFRFNGTLDKHDIEILKSLCIDKKILLILKEKNNLHHHIGPLKFTLYDSAIRMNKSIKV